MASRIFHILGMIAAAGALGAAGPAHAQESTLGLEKYLVSHGPTSFCQVRERGDDRHEADAEDAQFPPQREPISGVYPTEYYVRYRSARDEYTVSLEGFVYHEAQ